MTVFDALTALHDQLTADKIVCELDPYMKIAPPVVVIEIERSDAVATAATGQATIETHVATVTCLVSAQTTSYATFKAAAIAFGNTVMTSLHSTPSVNVVEKTKAYGETMLDSLKCSSVSYEVELYF